MVLLSLPLSLPLITRYRPALENVQSAVQKLEAVCRVDCALVNTTSCSQLALPLFPRFYLNCLFLYSKWPHQRRSQR